MFLLGLKAPEEMVTPALAHPSQGPCSLAEGKCSSVDLWHHLCLSKEMSAEAPGSPAQPAPICAGCSCVQLGVFAQPQLWCKNDFISF